jgi:hypothetical protein
MKFFSRHILALSRVSLLVIFLGSSGLTVILRTCTMGAKSCCVDMQGGCNDECDQPTSSNSGALIQSHTPCHISSVVGGLTTNPAVVEKQDRSVTSDQIGAFPTSLINEIADLNDFEALTPFKILQSTPPPSVDRYALIGSFLI